MGVLYGGEMGLAGALAEAFTPLSAGSFLLFVLLYTPCVAAISAIHREMGSFKWTAVWRGLVQSCPWRVVRFRALLPDWYAFSENYFHNKQSSFVEHFREAAF